LLQRAIPEALKKGQPGTVAFRTALREALENVKSLPASHGIFNMTATDHNGLDSRARVIVRIVDGKWQLQKD
jgi:branched-chain amino acid transport system substrate-binding protein